MLIIDWWEYAPKQWTDSSSRCRWYAVSWSLHITLSFWGMSAPAIWFISYIFVIHWKNSFSIICFYIQYLDEYYSSNFFCSLPWTYSKVSIKIKWYRYKSLVFQLQEDHNNMYKWIFMSYFCFSPWLWTFKGQMCFWVSFNHKQIFGVTSLKS